MEFEEPRYADFPALNLARHAGETGGTLPAVMNAANEIAVAAFLDRKIPFPGIWKLVAARWTSTAPLRTPAWMLYWKRTHGPCAGA